MFAKGFTRKKGLYTAMHNVKSFGQLCTKPLGVPCAMLPIFTQKKCVPTRKTHFVKSVLFCLGSVALYKYN